MSLKNWFFNKYAHFIATKETKKFNQASRYQKQVFDSLIKKNKHTAFGIKNNFEQIHTVEEYQANIPLSSYEDYLPYIEQLKQGKQNILTQEPTAFFLKTSGTTSGSKFIPMTRSGLKQQMNATLYMLCYYYVNNEQTHLFDHQLIFIQGSPKLDYTYAIPSGRLSGLVYNYIPKFFRKNTLPSYTVNCIENWDEKIDAIVSETIHKDLSGIGGIPPWCIQYFEKLLQVSNKKKIKDIFPNLEVYIYGGVDFSSYKAQVVKLLGDSVHLLQTFPASEGFFGYQDRLEATDMILLTHHGIFYEFIPFEEALNPSPKVFKLSEVILNEKYELVVTTLSGLYRYRMGDLIEFTSINPYRIKVVGRTQQFISAFGEHIILQEIENAISQAIEVFNLSIKDYLVSPNVAQKRYEWRIEWDSEIPLNKKEIENYLDHKLIEQNSYYRHLIDGHIIHSSLIIDIKPNTFNRYRNQNDKSGGQNKVVKIANTNEIAMQLDQLASTIT